MKRKISILVIIFCIGLTFAGGELFNEFFSNVTYAAEGNTNIEPLLVDETELKFEIVDTGEKFSTIEEALEEVEENEETTIKLLDDVTVTARINISSNHNIVFDLNGKTLTSNYNGSFIGVSNANGILTIKDTSIEQTGTIKHTPTANNSGYYVILNSGILTLENIRIESKYGLCNSIDAIMNIGNGTDNPTINVSNGIAIYLSSGTVNVNSGIITASNTTAIYLYNGILNINGGKIESTNGMGVYVYSYNGNFTFNDGKIIAPQNYAISAHKNIKFNGGKTIGKYKNYTYGYTVPEGHNIKITYEDALYTSQLIVDNEKPIIKLGEEYSDSGKFSREDSFWIYFYIEDYEVASDSGWDILDYLVLKTDGESVILSENNLYNYYVEDKTLEVEFKGIKGNGELTIEIPADTVFDLAGNGNELTVLTTEIVIDNTPPENISVQINGGATETTSNIVNLKLGAENVSEMWVKDLDYEIPHFEIDEYKVSVPTGFKIAVLDEYGDVIDTLEENEWDSLTREDIEAGLVIVDEFINEETGEITFGNEFVWIPCTLTGENETVRFGEKRYPIANFFYWWFNGEYPQDANTGEYNEFICETYGLVSEEEEADILLSYLTEKEFRNWVQNLENMDVYDKDYLLAGFEEFISGCKTYTNEDDEYVFESVEKYGGFYIGRYELGTIYRPKSSALSELIKDYVFVQKGREVIATDDYGMLYEISAALYPGLSQMMGTYSLDATLMWLEQNGIDTKLTHTWYISEEVPQTLDASGIWFDGVYNIDELTGQYEEDRVLNIYDLAGNYSEWIDEYIYYVMNPIAELSSDAGDVMPLDMEMSDYKKFAVFGITLGECALDLYNKEYFYSYQERSIAEEIDTYLMAAPEYATRPVLYVNELPEWIPYQEEMQFELTSVCGEKTVEVYYRDDVGNVAGPVLATITLKNEEIDGNKVSVTIYQNSQYTYEIEEAIINVDEIELVSDPINGTVKTDVENRKITYVPNQSFVGKEIFTVAIYEGNTRMEKVFEITVNKRSSSGGSSKKEETKVTQEQKEANILYANDDEFRGYVGEIISTTKELNLLSNDSSKEPIPYSVKEIIRQPKYGTLYKDAALTKEGVNSDGTFYYKPIDGFDGSDIFTYTLTDGTKVSDEAIVELIIKTYKLKEENESNKTSYINGYEDGTIRIDSNISREEVAMIFYRLTTSENKENFKNTTSKFNDIDSSRWSSNAIAFLSEAGILQGYPDGTFKPTQPVTRAEFAAIIERYSEIADTKKLPFKDIEKDHWASEAIKLVATQGWMQGYPDETFKPNNNITRGESMAVINRMLKRDVSNVKGKNNFSDLNENHWAYADAIEATTSY